MINAAPRTVHVFVSSPSDAEDERRRIVRLVERLNVDFADVARLEPILWEDRAYEAHQGFQEQIRKSADCDVVVAILRGRVGTPLSPEFLAGVPQDDRLGLGPTLTGTTYEIVTAIAARRRGKRLPDIYAFRYAAAPNPPLNAPNYADIQAQWKQLEAFIAQVFVTPEGYFKGALERYDTIDSFEAKADRALRQWLAENVIKGGVPRWPTKIKGSPFRGLEPFGFKHAEVFFGRQGDRLRAIDRLIALADEGFPFLVIVGPSGAGKSSFVRAGVAPALVKPGVVGEVRTWRVAVMRPSDGEDALDALARRLSETSDQIPPDDEGRPPALPELMENTTRAELRNAFRAYGRNDFASEQDRSDAREAVKRPVLRALERVSEAEKVASRGEKTAPARLLLIIDQLDEIFAASANSDAPAMLSRTIEVLASTGAVWVVTTLRAETLSAFLQSPMASLINVNSMSARAIERSINLAPPSITELGEIVRAPADAAGLSWQIDATTGQRLDDRVLADVDRSDLLPLLQFVLQQLFEQHETIDGSPMLAWEAFRRIGSIDGAINIAAEHALAGLATEDRTALPPLLRGLVAFPVGGGVADAQPALRRLPINEVMRDPHAKNLVKALIDARILVSTQGDPTPVVELAHRRVIEAWSAAHAIINENKKLLRDREDIETACDAWVAKGRGNDRLIPPGRRLVEAEAAAAALKNELAPDRLDYVRRSVNAATLRQRLLAGTAALMTLLAVTAGVSAWSFLKARDRAEQNLASAKQALQDLDDFIWNANQGAQSMVGARLSDVKALLGKIDATLDGASLRSPNDLDLLAIRASNLANFVDVYLVARSMRDAAAAAKEGMSTAAKMALLGSADRRTMKAQTMALYKRGDVRRESLDLVGALDDYREAERKAAALVSITPSDSTAQRLRWVATEKLGDGLLAARDPQAREIYKDATRLARSLANNAPTDSARQRDLALSLAAESEAARAAGEYEPALAAINEHLANIEALAREHPSDPLFARDEVLALLRVARVKNSNGDSRGAIADLDAALNLARANSVRDPLDARARHDLLAVLKVRSDTRLNTDPVGAKADLDEALGIARKFVSSDGGAALARYDLATVLMSFALNFDDTSAAADEAHGIVVKLADEKLLTPTDMAAIAQFDGLVGATNTQGEQRRR